jgi:hypothetical protein
VPSPFEDILRYPQKCQKPQKPVWLLYGADSMMTGCLARSIDIPCERSSFQALTALRQPLTASTRRIVQKSTRQTTFPVYAYARPTAFSARRTRAFRLTPLPSQNASKESPPKVLKLKTSFESTRRINILKSVNSSVRSPESLGSPKPPCALASGPHPPHRPSIPEGKLSKKKKKKKTKKKT